MTLPTTLPMSGRASALSDELTCRSFALNVRTLDEASRSVEAVIATESPVMAFDWKAGRMVHEVLLMSGLRMPAAGQVPLLDSHSRFSVGDVLGSCRDLRIEGDKLIGRNYFSKKPAAEEALTLLREGHLTDNSVGYRIGGDFVTIEPGKTAEVDGRRFTAAADRPLRVVRSWELFENSVCAIGADHQAKVRADAAPENNKPLFKEYRSMKFEEWLKKRGLTLDALTEQQAASLRADFDGEMQRTAAAEGRRAAEAGVDEAELLARGAKAELDRQKTIRQLAGDRIPAEIVQRAIDEGWTVDKAKDDFLARLRGSMTMQTAHAPAVQVRDTETNARQLEAAMLLRAGGLETAAVRHYGEQVVEQAEAVRDLALIDVCREALRLSGRTVPMGRDEMIRSAFSTYTLPQILGNVANKAMLAGYTALPGTWEKWCQIGSVQDFKTNTRVRLTDVGELEEVTNGGEVPHGSASEEYEQFAIATYAKQFAVTRKDIINDDLGALTKVPQKMGVKAAMKVHNLVYSHFLNPGNMADGVALFHAASHGNLNTSTALTQANLATAIKGFRLQKDADGEPISVEPKFLLVPPSLERIAREILESDLLIATGVGSSAATTANKNIWRGAMELIVEPRLENANYTGYSTSTWYVIADPATIDTVEVAFLNGRRTPTVERFDTNSDTMGVIYRVFIDCGVKALDFRGMQKNTQ